MLQDITLKGQRRQRGAVVGDSSGGHLLPNSRGL